MSESNQWHMKKEVNISHIVTTVAIAVSCFWFFADLDKQVSANSQSIDFIKQQRTEDSKRIEKRLDSIDRKMDELIKLANQ